MTLLHDLKPLLPSDEETAAGRDALVRELEAAPRAAGPRSFGRPRRMLRRGSVLVAAAALGIGAAVFVPRPDGVDVVESARAAIGVPSDGILHVVVRYEPNRFFSTGTMWSGDPNDGGRIVGKTTGDSERWTTDDPWHQRSIEFLDKPGGGVETIQTAYDGRTVSTRQSWEGKTDVKRLDPLALKEMDSVRSRLSSDFDSIASGLTEDPVTSMREFLRSGKIRDAGEAELRGDDVRRLVGTQPGYRDSGGTWSPAVTFEYFVDEDTYEPREVRATQILPARPEAEEPAARKERRLVQRWVFETFERLPRNAETEKLLEIDPTP